MVEAGFFVGLVDIGEKNLRVKPRRIYDDFCARSTKKSLHHGAAVDWRQRSIEEFGLEPIDDETNDKEVWKNYSHFRESHPPNDLDGEYYSTDDECEEYLIQECIQHIKTVIKGINAFDADDWLDHCHIKAKHDAWCYGTLMRADITAIVFSPLAIPHTIEFQQAYLGDPRGRHFRYEQAWSFGLRDFCHGTDDSDDEDNGGKSRKRPYFPSCSMQVLCQNRFLTNPSPPRGCDEQLEDIKVANFTTSTVERLRQWLYGMHKPLLSDLDLLRLLFVSSGCDDRWESIGGFTGYGWSASDALVQQFRDQGLLTPEMEEQAEEEDRLVGPAMNWVEYQAKLVTDTLSPMENVLSAVQRRKGQGRVGQGS